MAGAPIGNQNAARAKRFRAALARALGRALGGAQDNVDTALEAIAAQLVQAALRGEPWAIQEVANRFDGKPVQMVGGDEESGPVKIEGCVVLVRPE